MSERMRRTARELASDALGRAALGRPVLLVAHPSAALLEWIDDEDPVGPVTVVSTAQGADYYRAGAPDVEVVALDRGVGIGAVRRLAAFRRSTSGKSYGLALAGWAEGRPPTTSVIATVAACEAPIKGVLYEDGLVRLSPPWRFALLGVRQRMSARGGLVRRTWLALLLGLAYFRLGWVLLVRGVPARLRRQL